MHVVSTDLILIDLSALSNKWAPIPPWTWQHKTMRASALLWSCWLLQPDYLNLIFLSAGMYGMYQGVEIQHPLYSALFMILGVSWVLSLINIVAFRFLPSLALAKLTNIGSTCVLFFHSVCWLMTSLIRHLHYSLLWSLQTLKEIYSSKICCLGCWLPSTFLSSSFLALLFHF